MQYYLLEFDRVWISSGSILSSCLFGFGFEFFGFQNSKSFWVWVFRVYKNWLKTLRVYGFERKIWPKFGQNASFFFGKIFQSSELDLIEFQFSGFFRVGVLAIFRDQVFFGFGFRKIAKTHRGFKFGWTRSSSSKYLIVKYVILTFL